MPDRARARGDVVDARRPARACGGTRRRSRRVVLVVAHSPFGV